MFGTLHGDSCVRMLGIRAWGWGTVVRMVASYLIGSGFRSKLSDLKFCPTGLSLFIIIEAWRAPIFYLKLDVKIHVQAFPVEFTVSSTIKNYTTRIIFSRVTQRSYPLLASLQVGLVVRDGSI